MLNAHLNIVSRHQIGTLVHKNYNWCVALPKPNTVKTLRKFVDSFRAIITWFLGQGQDETAHKPQHYSITTQMCAFHPPGFLLVLLYQQLMNTVHTLNNCNYQQTSTLWRCYQDKTRTRGVNSISFRTCLASQGEWDTHSM